jgi:uncharacterized membrane protein YphA (DoxX/SURF4 family)
MVRSLCPRRHRLQKLFSNFPDGWPGIGLFLIRLAVSLSAIVQGVCTLVVAGNSGPTPWAIGLLEIIVGVALLFGVLTPIAGVLAALVNLLTAISLPLTYGANTHAGMFAAIDVLVMSTAIVLLGPGAYSVDARLFGRREIIIPEGRQP